MQTNSLIKIRKDIESCINRNVRLKADKGRKRIVEREGILEAAYPNLFIVKVGKDNETVRRVSYTYTDVLTGTVEVTVLADKEEKEKIS